MSTSPVKEADGEGPLLLDAIFMRSACRFSGMDREPLRAGAASVRWMPSILLALSAARSLRMGLASGFALALVLGGNTLGITLGSSIGSSPATEKAAVLTTEPEREANLPMTDPRLPAKPPMEPHLPVEAPIDPRWPVELRRVLAGRGGIVAAA